MHKLKFNYLPIIAISLCIFVGLLYLLTAVKPHTPYNYFTLLGEQFLIGKYYLPTAQSWLSELVQGSDNRWFVVYPPMPAIMTLPFILFGINSQTTIAIIIGALNILLYFIIFNRLFGKKVGIIFSLFLAFGTNHWFLASEGSAWYFSHICAIFFLLLTIVAVNLRRIKQVAVTTDSRYLWLLAGLSLGAAYWSRLPTILVLPFFIYLILNKKLQITQKFYLIVIFSIGCLLFVIANFGYNYVRFGTILDKAYYLIPGVLEEPWYQQGIFNISYFVRNLQFILFKMPLAYEQFPFLKPSIGGMAIWLTTPLILLLPLVKWKEKWTIVLSLTALLMLLPALLHGTVGFTQFGYRFGLEATSLWLIVLGTAWERHHGKLLITVFGFLSVIINFWGVFFIRSLNIFGW